MIKQTETDKKLVFGVDFEKKKKRVQNVAKPLAPPAPKHPCKFQENETQEGRVKSIQCKNEALANGWCEEHQDAQIGMDLGAKINYRSIEIAEAYTIIGQGEKNWLAYFERAGGKGLATVLSYLQKRIGGM